MVPVVPDRVPLRGHPFATYPEETLVQGTTNCIRDKYGDTDLMILDKRIELKLNRALVENCSIQIGDLITKLSRIYVINNNLDFII